jgi:predicted RNase H-like HicB family nuclease
VIERTATGDSAHSPDLSGCVAIGTSREATECKMREAIAFHLNELKAEGAPIPESSSSSSYVDIRA